MFGHTGMFIKHEWVSRGKMFLNGWVWTSKIFLGNGPDIWAYNRMGFWGQNVPFCWVWTSKIFLNGWFGRKNLPEWTNNSLCDGGLEYFFRNRKLFCWPTTFLKNFHVNCKNFNSLQGSFSKKYRISVQFSYSEATDFFTRSTVMQPRRHN